MNLIWRNIAVAVFVAMFCSSGFGQTAEQPVELIIELDNTVTYRGDVTDAAKLARDPGMTTPLPARAFQYTHNVGDIVAVNGKPAKGLFMNRVSSLVPSLNPQPGQMIADYDGDPMHLCVWHIMGPDGVPIGALLDGGGPPGFGHTVSAGYGAFFGVIGIHRSLESIRRPRVASVTEDPANRRIHGGGRARHIFRLYPKYRPAVDVTTNGPAVYHAEDFSQVTATRPARAGELLILGARNLGPTKPDLLPPGSRLFGPDPFEFVNSPVEVTVSGKDAEVIHAIGWPDTSDLYRVAFRVPTELTPGMAGIRLTAGWIPGPEVKIPLQ